MAHKAAPTLPRLRMRDELLKVMLGLTWAVPERAVLHFNRQSLLCPATLPCNLVLLTAFLHSAVCTRAGTTAW